MSDAYHYSAVVRRLVDADTVSIDVSLGFGVWHMDMHVRLFGINAPELSTEAGKAALAYLQTLLRPGDPVSLESIKDHADKYGGRYLGVLRVPGAVASVNDAMIASGHAVVWDGTGPKPTWGGPQC